MPGHSEQAKDRAIGKRLPVLLGVIGLLLVGGYFAYRPVRIWLNVAALRSSSPEVRRRARESLAEIGPDAVPALIKALGHRHESPSSCSARSTVDGRIVEALVEIGPDALPALIEELRRKHIGNPRRVVEALMQIDPGGAAALPVLAEPGYPLDSRNPKI